MKACSECNRLYPDDAGFCPVDGKELVSATLAPVAAADDDARIGQVMCSRYQVRRVVADGGMGRVYEALDMVERRNVALKILHPDVATDNVSLERFKREFEVSQLLPHNHIVEVSDFQATHDGSYALVMEFLYGEELRAMLKREQVMPPERVIRMISQIALALDEAHARKLVHRDLKPDNVFLCQTREGDIVKILDFGSVKDKSDPAKKLTVMGTTIGSPYYMAPEQAQGLETLDHRADVWALAAISYECLTGTVPFKGNNGPSILLEILTKDPTPPSVAAAGRAHTVPPTVDRVMVHAFKKNPSLRIGSVGAFADALGHAFGLTGTHQEWATVPQDQLGATVTARLPEMMVAAAPPPADAADNFFGESEAFGAQSMGVSPAAMGAHPMAPQGVYQDDLVPMGVPKSGNFGLLLAVAVGGIALLVGVLIVVVLFR
ncbi:MAG: serine/threonine protein kinase [Myxococcales bacterium]|nr:serine/threonine protein kinase [Myxococcales bacterium]